MLYLLIKQPTMMFNVAGLGKIRFRDTGTEAKFFKRREQRPAKGAEPIHVKADQSKSVLFDGCISAKELSNLKLVKWKIMSRVWVQLTCYAAIHCRAEAQAQIPSKGGAHDFCLALDGNGEQLQINEGHARAKLIVSG
ncbi:hypothetical protein EUGRSUZ_D00771 [Eucalyptus grandis]|uniref:Uncharacterized protein n=2 Tax=Eucalyptus grandis TaxID=71139 RepID=A0ACC3L3Y6_EUCGR|nr:hypothetical protein EUGRSUZ_D00771 [Eucalyptus grandis]